MKKIKMLPKRLMQNYIFSFVSVVSGVLGLALLTNKNGIEYVGSISVYLTSIAIYLAFESGSFQYFVSYFINDKRKQSLKIISFFKILLDHFLFIMISALLSYLIIVGLDFSKYQSAIIILMIIVSLCFVSLSLLARAQFAARKFVNINSKMTAITLVLRYLGLYILSDLTDDLILHFLYLTVVTIIESLIRIYSARQLLYHPDFVECTPIAPLKSKVSVGIGALSIAGDRWCIGFLYEEKELGIYTLALNASAAVMNLVGPLVAFMLPYLIEDNKDAKKTFYKNIFTIYSIISFSVAIVAFFSWVYFDSLKEYLTPIVINAFSIVMIIYFGAVINSLAEPIYARWLGNNRYDLIFSRNLLSILYLAAITTILNIFEIVSLEMISMLHVINGLIIYLMDFKCKNKIDKFL